MNTTLEYSTRVVQEGDRRCKKSTLNDLAYLTPLGIPLMNPEILRLLHKKITDKKMPEHDLALAYVPFLISLSFLTVRSVGEQQLGYI